jgi:hypothetical protein
MKLLKLFSLMLVATTMAACSSDDNDATSQRSEVRALSFEVSETPYAIPNGSRITRAAIASSLDKFYLNYVYGSEPRTNGSSIETTKDGEKGWKVGDGFTGWPDTENTVDWYACSENVTFNTSGPYINFSVNETASDQKDLLVATASGTYAGTGGKLSFTFNHVCSALRIYVKKAKNLADYTLTVSEVKLCNVASQGYYYFNTSFNTSSWTLGATKSNYTLYSGAGLTLGTESFVLLGDSSAPYLFLLPQTLTAWSGSGAPANTYLELTCVINKNEGGEVHNGQAYIPFGAVLEKGYEYDVNINIGKNSLYKGNGTKIIPS